MLALGVRRSVVSRRRPAPIGPGPVSIALARRSEIRASGFASGLASILPVAAGSNVNTPAIAAAAIMALVNFNIAGPNLSGLPAKPINYRRQRL